MTKVKRCQGPLEPGSSAQYHFPQIFQKKKNEYMLAMIRRGIEDTIQDEKPGKQLKSVDVYLGNLHVSPLCRLWNTTDLTSIDSVKGQVKTLTNDKFTTHGEDLEEKKKIMKT